MISVIAGAIFISCKKESSFNGNQSPDEVAGARSRGKVKPGPPVADAGPDQTIILPANPATLDGSASIDPNNNISGYLWRKISGPSSFSIGNANAAQTQVTNLIAGVYEFELKVTDAGGLFDKDTMQLTVMMMNLPPPCTTCKIVFVSARDGNNEIYTSNTDGSNITRLTNDPGDDGQPKWSPDGTRIAFIRNSNLFIMNDDGSNVVQRTFSGGCQDPTWSPDGTKIAFSDDADYGKGIYVISATGGSQLMLFEVVGGGEYVGDVMQPTWSPDGTTIALVVPTFVLNSFGDDYIDIYHIYTINSDRTGFTALTSGYDHFFSPVWSPNGAKLAVVYNYTNVGLMNSDGSGFTLLTSGAEWGTGTSWSSDGTAIVYSSSSGNVSWVAADGSAGGLIVTNGWNADWKH